LHYEAVIKDRKIYGPFSRVLVVAESKDEAEEFARRVYSEKLVEIKELF